MGDIDGTSFVPENLAGGVETPCATCGGTGYWTATRSEVAAGAPPPPAPFNTCAVCEGSGIAPCSGEVAP